MEVWQGGRDGQASILQILFPKLRSLLYYFLRYLEQPVWLPLGCLFWYQLFICLAFYAVLLENLAMEHLTQRGSKLKNFHLHTELLHISRGLTVCLPPSFMMGLWFQPSLQTDTLFLFRKHNSRKLYQTLMITYALHGWRNSSRTYIRQLCDIKGKSAPVSPASQFPSAEFPPNKNVRRENPNHCFKFQA